MIKKAVAETTTAKKTTVKKTTTSAAELAVSGNKKIKSLEKEFDTVFGLYSQICAKADGKRYYTSGNSDDMTLSAFNAMCEKAG